MAWSQSIYAMYLFQMWLFGSKTWDFNFRWPWMMLRMINCITKILFRVENINTLMLVLI